MIISRDKDRGFRFSRRTRRKTGVRAVPLASRWERPGLKTGREYSKGRQHGVH
jgi:hypothetical protein